MTDLKSYTLRVIDAEVTALWERQPSWWKRQLDKIRPPTLTVEISTGDTAQRTTAVEKTTCPTWNELFPLLWTETSLLSIRVLAKDFCIGYANVSMDELQDKDKEGIILISNVNPESKETGIIHLQLEESNAKQNADLALENFNRFIPTTHPETWTYFKVLYEVQPSIDALADTIDDLSFVQDYSRIIRTLLLIPSTADSPRMQFGNPVGDLTDTLKNTCSLLRKVREITKPIEVLQSNKDQLLNFVTRCFILSTTFVRHNFMGRLDKQKDMNEMQGFWDSLEKLLNDLNSSFLLQLIETTGKKDEPVKENHILRGKVYEDEDWERRDEQLKELKKILQPLEVPSIEGERSRCLQGTRVELLDEIRTWIRDTTKPNLFLLTGQAGTGKSTVARTAALGFKKETGGYICFTRGKIDLVSSANSILNSVIQTIAYGLACDNTSIADSIHSTLSESKSVDFPSTDIMFDKLLYKPLRSAVRKGMREPLLFAIDALDECGSKLEEKEQLVLFIKEKLPTLPNNIRFLITSRPEEAIDPLLSLSSSLCVHERLENNKEDVLRFIKYEMEDLRLDKYIVVPPDWPWDESMEALGDAANGLFIWGATAVRLIKYSSGIGVFGFLALKKLVDASKVLEKSLHGLYTWILENKLKWEDETTRERFEKVFSIILFAKTTITDTEIDDFWGFERGATEDILCSIRSLVQYAPYQPIYVNHISLYDYLVSDASIGKGWYINPNPESGMMNIMLRCFDLMESRLRFNICELETSFLLNHQVLDLKERVEERIGSLSYACCCWSFHLRDVSYSKELASRVESLVLNKLLFWIEVLSLTGTLHTYVWPALENAIDWLKDKHPRITTFLNDAQESINKFIEPISQATPHIYMSYLPLMRTESIVAQHYAERMKFLTDVQYTGVKPGTACIRDIAVNESVLAISYTPDGTQIMFGSMSRISVWDSKDGHLVSTPVQTDTSSFCSVAFSVDGKYIMTGLDDGSIRVWDRFKVNHVCREFEGHEGRPVKCVVFTDDGKYIASGSDDKLIRLWNVKSGKQFGEPLKGQSGSVTSLSFSPDGRYLASGSDAGSLVIWNIKSRSMKLNLTRDDSDPISSVSFSEDGSKIASSSRGNVVRVWDVSGDGHMLKECKFQERRAHFQVSVVKFYDNNHILFGADGGMIYLWNIKGGGNDMKTFKGHTGGIEAMSISPDRTRFVSGSSNGTLKIWDADRDVFQTYYERVKADISAFAVSPDGRYSVSGSIGGTINVWGMDSGELIKGPLEGHTSVLTSVVFSPDNIHFASGSMDHSIIIWNINEGFTRRISHSDTVNSISFSPDGEHIASASFLVRVWEVKSGKLVLDTFIGHGAPVRSIAYSPDGKKFATGGDDQTVRIWNASSGRMILVFRSHSVPVIRSVAFSHDGSYIVSGTHLEILVWSAHNGEIISTLDLGFQGHIYTGISFSPDSKWIVSSKWYTTICLWDTSSGELFFQAHASENAISIAFLPSFDNDTIRFVSSSSKGSVKIWSVDVHSHERTSYLDYQGWLKGKGGSKLIWIPEDLRTSLIHGPCTHVFNTSLTTKLLLSDYQGRRWTTCVQSSEDSDFTSISNC